MRWTVPMTFAIFIIRPWTKFVEVTVLKRDSQLTLSDLLFFAVVIFVAILFSLAKRYPFRITTIFYVTGCIIAGIGFFHSRHTSIAILGGSGVAILTYSVYAMFIRALTLQKQPCVRSEQSVVKTITQFFSAVIMVLFGNLLLFSLFCCFLPVFLDTAMLSGKGVFALFAFGFGNVIYSAMIGASFIEREMIEPFWGKWALYIFPHKIRLLVGAALFVIPLCLSFAWLTGFPRFETTVLLLAAMTEVILMWKSVAIYLMSEKFRKWWSRKFIK